MLRRVSAYSPPPTPSNLWDLLGQFAALSLTFLLWEAELNLNECQALQPDALADLSGESHLEATLAPTLGYPHSGCLGSSVDLSGQAAVLLGL